MSYYQHHLFFCCNERAENETCCAHAAAEVAQTYAKDRVGELKLKGRGKVRITNRRGDVLNPNGPTAAEVVRAMDSARKTQKALAEKARR